MADNDDCTGDGTTSQSCTLSDLGAGGEKHIYIACQDTVGNKDSAETNEVLTYTLDAAPPVPSNFSPASASTITDATQDITFDTDENATCKISLTDQAYGDMAGDACTGGGTQSQSCTAPDLGADGAKSVYIACTDGTNADTAETNEALAYTLDTTPPAPSNFSPASSSVVNDVTPSITFSLNENGDCRASVTDESYGNMSDDTDCTGDGTQSVLCTPADLGEDGEKVVYVACRDAAGNEDAAETNEALTYTLDTAVPSLTFSPEDGATIVTATPAIAVTLNEEGDCFASVTDESYDDMSDDVDCDGDGTTSVSCAMTDLGDDGAKTVYISCQDTAGNKDTADTNNAVSYMLDTVSPTPSDFSPASASTITDAGQTVTFDLDEEGDCFASVTDESYDDMSDDDDCTGDGTTSISCTLSDLGADGAKTVYISCRDTAGNKDSADTNEALTYTLDTNVCGDGDMAGAETCDDGNAAAGDGCSDSCILESGYTCATPGQSCVADAVPAVDAVRVQSAGGGRGRGTATPSTGVTGEQTVESDTWPSFADTEQSAASEASAQADSPVTSEAPLPQAQPVLLQLIRKDAEKLRNITSEPSYAQQSSVVAGEPVRYTEALSALMQHFNLVVPDQARRSEDADLQVVTAAKMLGILPRGEVVGDKMFDPADLRVLLLRTHTVVRRMQRQERLR
ncbi:MAG: myxococcus cysteine-rich repeat containing protein [Candidatus Peribacteraceae bacterium]|nr:myxococcus cysteine-rich repeat containing protein [Candidatus Peribacteraceae bacterium]